MIKVELSEENKKRVFSQWYWCHSTYCVSLLV